ncbi:MAG: DUF2268 domain-containing putative Zn-dependent protease [Candidatus Nanohaloarchaea archaeon]
MQHQVEGGEQMSYSVKPQSHELEEAKRTVEQALQACEAVSEKEGDIVIELGWTGDEYAVEKLGGASGFTHSEQRIELKFNTEPGNWKNFLQAAVAHEYAHTLFFEKHDEIVFNWQDILFEAHAQHFAEKVFPEKEVPWREKYSREELESRWRELKEIMGDELDSGRSLMYGGGEFPEWTGYSLAYAIGEKLLRDRDLDELPELKRSSVIEAGDELFR